MSINVMIITMAPVISLSVIIHKVVYFVQVFPQRQIVHAILVLRQISISGVVLDCFWTTK